MKGAYQIRIRNNAQGMMHCLVSGIAILIRKDYNRISS